MIPKVGIIGKGFIGPGVWRACLEIGWDVKFISKTRYIELYNNGILECNTRIKGNIFEKALSGVDIVFLCIPTLDDGNIAKNYIILAIKAGKIIVIAEKGSWGNCGEKIFPHKDKIGSSAVVGGSSMILPYLITNLPHDFKVMRLVINGTCNYILFMMSLDYSFETATKIAKTLGYAEPNNDDPLQILNGEICGDVSMKITALHNRLQLNPGSFLKAKDIETTPITPSEFEKIKDHPEKYRYIVSIERLSSPYATQEHDNAISVMDFKFGAFRIRACFEDILNEPFSKLILPSVNNGVLINDTGNIFPTNNGEPGAPGAGIKTVDAMMRDAKKLLKL